jgi:hypothetical protein
MEQLKPWYVLDIDISNAIRDDFDFDKLLADTQATNPSPVHMWSYLLDNVGQLYSQDWLDYMKNIGLPVLGTLIFWRQADYQHPTMHIDSPHKTGGKLGLSINWCVGPDSAEMVWYETPSTPGNFGETNVGSLYQEWPIENGIEITRCCIGPTPTVVRIDIPHNVIMNNQPRLSISCRIDFRTDTWEQAVEFVKPFIVE